MSVYVNSIVDEDTITCGVCLKSFNTDEITTDDYYFAWDNVVHTDCCSKCSTQVLIGGNTMTTEYKQGWRWIVWVGGVDDYYVDYDRAKEHYDEWIEKGYTEVQIEEISENTTEKKE